MSISKKIRKLFCENNNAEVFYRFAKEDNGFLANWGSTNEKEYAHLGKMSKFSFNDTDKVFKFRTNTYPLASEALFNKIASKSERAVKEKLLDSDYADFEDLFIDSVVANRIKKHGYDGIVFEFTNNPGKYAMDIRNHADNVDKIYNGFMSFDTNFLGALK